MSKQDTVVEQKKLFLQMNKQLLSRGIVPSERLRTLAVDGGIDMGVLKGALDKVNRDLKSHSRKVYSRQMMEHLVEQIDELYWQSGAPPYSSDVNDPPPSDLNLDEIGLYQTSDLTLDDDIQKLPDTLAHFATGGRDASSARASQDDYLDALSRLQHLSARRQVLQNRLATYRTLATLLEPLKKPKENVQPNLVWKDSPLAHELARTRTLALRVAGRVGERWSDFQVRATEVETDVNMSELKNAGKKKVNDVLASW